MAAAGLAGVLACGLSLVTLVIPEARKCPPPEVLSGPKFEQQVTERHYWLRKSLAKSDVRMHLGEPARVDSYGLLTFWRYPDERTIIFDASGYVIGWENF